MTTSQQFMLQLTASALNPNLPAPSVPDEFYQEIEAEGKAQTILPLIRSKNPLSESKDERAIALGTNIRSFHRLMQTQSEVSGLLAEIPHVILKGAAAAQYYPCPEYRQMGDIDMIVLPEDYEAAFHILTQNGYRFQEMDDKRHTAFRAANGIEIELHNYFSEEPGKELDKKIFRDIRNAEKRMVCGYEVRVLPDETNGLVLLEHIHHHLNSGLGLRQVVDWMMYVKAVLDDEAWSSFRSAAESIGRRKLAETVTKMCKKYLGLNSVSWCDCADEELADELMEYILNKGNFGRKQEDGKRETMEIMHRFYHPIAAFRYLQKGGTIRWKAAKEHKVLRPFAWIYQIGHLLRMGAKRKEPLKIFLSEFMKSGREVGLLKRLENY